MRKIILIEGLPGSGKCSIAQFISDLLISEDRPNELLLEASTINPFRYGQGTSEKTDVSDFITSIRRQWKDFASLGVRKMIFLIQESMTFQQQVNFLLWMDRSDAPDVGESTTKEGISR